MKLACLAALGSVPLLWASAQPQRLTRVDETFDGRRVALRVGATLVITLPENGSTGYQWSIPEELRIKFAKVIRAGEQTVQAPHGPPGSSGRRRLHFLALAAGSAEIELHYRRPWEHGAPPARKFRLRILVRNKDR